MPITFGYEPVGAVGALAERAGRARAEEQQDRLAQRRWESRLNAQLTREGRAQQLYGQRMQQEDARQRMLIGADLDRERMLMGENFFRQRMDLQNAASAERMKQQYELMGERDTAQNEEAQRRLEEARTYQEQREAEAALLEARQAQAQLAKRQEDENFYINVIGRLNDEGQSRYQQIQQGRAALEKAYNGGGGKGRISEETYTQGMAQFDEEERSLDDPAFVAAEGKKPGDHVEKDGIVFITNTDGIQEFGYISDQDTLFEKRGRTLAWLDGKPVHRVATVPTRGGSKTIEEKSPALEYAKKDWERYDAAMNDYRTEMRAYEKELAREARSLYDDDRKEQNDSLSMAEWEKQYSAASDERKRDLELIKPSPPKYASVADAMQDARNRLYDPPQRPVEPKNRLSFTPPGEEAVDTQSPVAAPPPAPAPTSVAGDHHVMPDGIATPGIRLEKQLQTAFPQATAETIQRLASTMPRIMSEEEYANLPSGEYYVNPNGDVLRKK